MQNSTHQIEGKSKPANTPRCEKHDFPMLKINGQLECVAEYLDRCIGQETLTDIIQHGQTTFLVFENGHELPMLCSCCDGPLDYDETSSRDMLGRRLENMAINYETLEDGREIEELVLVFSKKSWESDPIGLPVSFKVARQMRHPANCPYRARPARVKSPAKRKQRSRKIPGRN